MPIKMIPEPQNQEKQILEKEFVVEDDDDNHVEFLADERMRKPKGKKIRKMRYSFDR